MSRTRKRTKKVDLIKHSKIGKGYLSVINTKNVHVVNKIKYIDINDVRLAWLWISFQK